MKRFVLNRRALLRGIVGGSMAAVALPTLEAMLNHNGDAYADGSGLPIRFMTYFWGNGIVPDRWQPIGEGAGYQLSEELAPIANVKDYCSVLTGYQNLCNRQITHHEGMSIFNGYSFTDWDGGLYSKPGGPTIDQVIADAIGNQTTFRSIETAVSKRMSIMDAGTTMFYLAHKGTDEPLPPERNPQALWQKLFGNFVAPEDPSVKLRVSVLDSVRADAAKLSQRLGTKDKQRLEFHLEAINELEKQIQALPPTCTTPPMPSETNTDVNGQEFLEPVSKAMNELIRYAFSCDLTRVSSLLFSGGASETIYYDINQSTVHHMDTHNWPDAESRINQAVIFNMTCFADLLARLMNTTLPQGGNLLDQCVIFMGSDCSEGWTHSIFNQPIIVAGGGGGKLVHPGVHYASTTNENPTDILLTCLRIFDPSAPSVGGDTCISTTPCAALTPA